MSSRTRRPSLLLVALHVFLTFMTGGAWLVVLIIWYLLSKKN